MAAVSNPVNTNDKNSQIFETNRHDTYEIKDSHTSKFSKRKDYRSNNTTRRPNNTYDKFYNLEESIRKLTENVNELCQELNKEKIKRKRDHLFLGILLANTKFPESQLSDQVNDF